MVATPRTQCSRGSAAGRTGTGRGRRRLRACRRRNRRRRHRDRTRRRRTRARRRARRRLQARARSQSLAAVAGRSAERAQPLDDGQAGAPPRRPIVGVEAQLQADLDAARGHRAREHGHALVVGSHEHALQVRNRDQVGHLGRPVAIAGQHRHRREIGGAELALELARQSRPRGRDHADRLRRRLRQRAQADAGDPDGEDRQPDRRRPYPALPHQAAVRRAEPDRLHAPRAAAPRPARRPRGIIHHGNPRTRWAEPSSSTRFTATRWRSAPSHRAGSGERAERAAREARAPGRPAPRPAPLRRRACESRIRPNARPPGPRADRAANRRRSGGTSAPRDPIARIRTRGGPG